VLFTHRRSITAVVFVGLLLVVVGGVAMHARTEGGPTPKSTSTEEVDRRALALPTTLQNERVESELITILSTEFQPAEITRPPGRFLIPRTRAWLAHFPAPFYGAAAVSQNRSERVEVEVIRLLPTGFEPTEIKRPPGRFILVVNNHSGINEMEIQLDAETRTLAEGRLPKGKKRWRTVIEAAPGRYVLTALGRLERTAYITITSQ
jgi:hypothetical protein